MSRRVAIALLATISLVTVAPCAAVAATLIGDPYINGFQNWIDPTPARLGDWRLNLHSNTVMETSDLAPSVAGAGQSPAPGTNNGAYVNTLLVQNNFTTPATYDINAKMFSSDDDGWGLIWGYQGPNDYYRVLFRAQTNGNLGGTFGTSVQRVAGGVITQLGSANTAFPTLAQIATRQPFNVKVAVNGTNYAISVAGVNSDNPLLTGSDNGLLPGKIGINSWAQQIGPNTDNPYFGTEVETISVADSSGTLYTSPSFVNPTSVSCRTLVMTNSAGLRTDNIANAAVTGAETGNFGLSLNGPWIHQRGNGFLYATGPVGAGPFDHIDFTGPAIVVNNPGSTGLMDYEMKVRIGATDDDGLGVLVRVQDDNNFYRINFSRQSITDATNSRAPGGLSIQKIQGGVWSEIFRDNQTTPLFTYLNGAGNPSTPMPKFDLRVRMVGNTFDIQVIDNTGNIINYPLISDSSGTPLLSGSVGFTTWGTENVYYSSYGGQAGTPLLVDIPEPGTIALVMLASVGFSIRGRRRAL